MNIRTYHSTPSTIHLWEVVVLLVFFLVMSKEGLTRPYMNCTAPAGGEVPERDKMVIVVYSGIREDREIYML